MELYEHIVLAYLTKDPYVFVSPQYSIKADQGEWSCPDFVALNFRDRRVSVIEVSTASNPKALREKVRNRDKHWLTRLKEQLHGLAVIDDSWQFDVQLFIRKAAVKSFEQQMTSLGADTKVNIKSLEDLGAPWEWARS